MESLSSRPHEPVELAIERLADQCVMCGLCLPHCPTYRVARSEGESPRGRVALARALVAGLADESATSHIDNCLACGSCAQVCPSKVEFLPLLAATRTLAPMRVRDAQPRRRLRALARRPGLLRAVLAVRALGRTRIGAAIARRNGVAPGAARAIALAPRAWMRGRPVSFTPAAGQRRGVLGLFRGCAASVLDADTQHAAVHVLTRLGYDVHAPADPHCCGALAWHAGDSQAAREDADDARDAFAGLELDAIVHATSGCDATLRATSRAPVHELMSFLAREPAWPWRTDAPRVRRAALLVPCTQRAIADEGALMPLLARVPGLEVSPLPLQPRCCGAAGLHFVDHEAQSLPLRDERVQQLRALAPELLLTTNIGCRLWLHAGLAEAGLVVPVVHPVTAISEALAT